MELPVLAHETKSIFFENKQINESLPKVTIYNVLQEINRNSKHHMLTTAKLITTIRKVKS